MNNIVKDKIKKTICILLVSVLIFVGNASISNVTDGKAGYDMVQAQAAAVRLNRTNCILDIGSTINLKVLGTRKKAKWSTSNRRIATVGGNGLVTAKKAGKCVITAKIGRKKYRCRVSVSSKGLLAKRANKAYAYFLAKNQSCFVAEPYNFQKQNNEKRTTVSSFFVADLNGDRIPELITYHENAYQKGVVQLYTYKEGKITALCGSNNKPKLIEINSQACGYFDIYVCSRHHFHTVWHGGNIGYEEKIYVVSNGKMKSYLMISKEYMCNPQRIICKKNGKNISQKLYNSHTAKCRKMKNSGLMKNNKENRNNL